MSNVIQFNPASADDPIQNLGDFVAYCRDTLSIYEDQGGFSVNQWEYRDQAGRAHAMRFAEFTKKNDPYSFTPFREPFLSFAKSWVRFNQEKKQVTSIGNKTSVLAAIYTALIELGRSPDILEMDGAVLERTDQLVRDRNSEGRRYHIGNELELLCEFLRDKAICPALPIWNSPHARQRYRAQGTTKADKQWQEERCPSMHQMLQLADIFRQAETEKDLYWSSVIALLMFAPSRGSEPASLMIDSLIEEDGRLYVRWFPRKKAEWMQKAVPVQMEAVVREAFERLIKIGEPARVAAKFAYENPDTFLRHRGCITRHDFGEDEPLDALQFACARCCTDSVINKLMGIKDAGKSLTSATAWNVVGANNMPWLKKIYATGSVTYRKLAQYAHSEYRCAGWPNIFGSNRPIWDSLTIVLDRQFRSDAFPNKFSWVIPNINALNGELGGREFGQSKSGNKYCVVSIFDRFGKVDEDGSPISLTSHQLRVWISTWAERAGMDAWQLAQWAGRARVDDNKAYDLRPASEKYELAKSVLTLAGPPSALQAVEMNLPVTYESLGIERPGVANATLYGFCIKDWAMSPCIKGGGDACAACDDHACIKGLDDKLENLVALEAGMSMELQRAANELEASTFMADSWYRFLGFRLAKIRTIISELQNPDRPVGAIVRVPSELDPSPLQRARASVIPDVSAEDHRSVQSAASTKFLEWIRSA